MNAKSRGTKGRENSDQSGGGVLRRRLDGEGALLSWVILQRALMTGIFVNMFPWSYAREQNWVEEDIREEGTWRTKVPQGRKMQLF